MLLASVIIYFLTVYLISYIFMQSITTVIISLYFYIIVFILAEKNLTVPIDDESFLIKFLRPCRYNPDTAFKMLKKFYKFKVKYPKYGINITPVSVRQVFDNEVFCFLPTRTSSGGRIMIINCGSKYIYCSLL